MKTRNCTQREVAREKVEQARNKPVSCKSRCAKMCGKHYHIPRGY